MVQWTVYLNFLSHLFFLIMLDHQFFWHNFASEDFFRVHFNNFIAFCKTTLLIENIIKLIVRIVNGFLIESIIITIYANENGGEKI